MSLEQLLQTRSTGPDERKVEDPWDETPEEAVSRMTQAAKTERKPGLVPSTKEWQQLEFKHLANPDIIAFAQEITKRVGEVQRLEDLNRWQGLAMNIWNTTPQPNRGGKPADEMSQEGHQGPE